ncbi:hypothetical protein R3P38DRAFT_2790675 [Favolaschia claudopus]|uniref:Transposase n=1 Tax=Favolaschia claudopus TaxID=2862362 RepID=A0AAW0AK60_9AGAR
MANKPAPLKAPNLKPTRVRTASKRLVDDSNSEAPSAAHHSIVDQTQARLDTAATIAHLIQDIEDLDALLPDTIAEGTEADENDYPRLGLRLSREDNQCRDANGRLRHVRRGDLGMLMVAQYLRDVKWGVPAMNLPGVLLQLERVVKEMEILSGVDRAEVRKKRGAAATKSKPSARKAGGAAASPSAPAPPGQTDAFEQLFQATLGGETKRHDKSYKPKNTDPTLSEEEEDDFMDVDGDEPPSNDSKKRKIIVVDGVPQAPGPKKKKKTKKTAPPAPPPEIEVIEVDDESEDEVRVGGKRGPASNTRLHYSEPTAVNNGGDKRWSFKCQHKGCTKVITFKRTVSKTQHFSEQRPAPNLGNLATQLKDVHEGEPPPSGAKPGVVHDDYLCLDHRRRPPTGETPGIQRLFSFLQTRYLLPSDTTEVKAKIAVATDTWTTRAMTYTFAGTIGSWISSEWELVQRVLDFHPIEDKEHQGEYAALGLAKQLNELQALEKISFPIDGLNYLAEDFLYLIAVALDNASPNTVLVMSLSKLLMKKFDIQFVPANSQIHCLAHVVNLVVQKILAALDATDATDEYLNNKYLPFHYDPQVDPEQIRLEEEVFTKEDDEGDEEDEAAELLAGILDDEYAEMSPLQKLRTATTKICSSPQRRKRFRATAERMYGDEKAPSGRPLASLMVVRDVRHRWNYTHAMIKRGYRYLGL